jgi:hypothetical protein
MKALAISMLPIAMAMLAASATAQTDTDEARAVAAQATAEQQREASTRPPVAESAAPGDYRAEAHQRHRMLQWETMQRAVRAYAAGARSQPLTVNSEESARAEAQRLHAEQALAERAAVLRSAAAAQ